MTSYTKKGIKVGLIIGIVWAIIGGLGVFFCHWNPAEGSVVPSGICGFTPLIFVFYLPLMVVQLLLMLFGFLTRLGETFTVFVFFIVSPFVEVGVFTLIGALIGWLVGRKKSGGAQIPSNTPQNPVV